MVESGGGNLYRRDSGGSYELITNLAPENPSVIDGHYFTDYAIDAVTADCSRVVFETKLHYPGVVGGGTTRLYEWHEGTLSGVGLVPDGGGGEAAAEEARGGTALNHVNVLSEGGLRLFFSAKRLSGKVSGEVGKTGVFVREGGHAYDISTSETSTPDEGATYIGSTPDGSRAYFTANAGLTSESSESGTDLYEYDLQEEELTDLTPKPGSAAKVQGLVGLAEDGSHVYFAARAQLLPGRGPTTAENEAANRYSLYDATTGGPDYVGTALSQDLTSGRLTTANQQSWTARTSPDGRYLAFESSADITGYESGGRPEVYLYDAEAAAGSESIVCVSCRQDGESPYVPPEEGPAVFAPLLAAGGQTGKLYEPRSLVVRDGEPIVFFRSIDPLAPGAPAGEFSLYEWSHGQVFHLAAQPSSTGPTGVKVQFIGASADGTDVYFFDPAVLNWENREERYAAWDARVGGGFAEPPAPPAPCDPDSEGACEGSTQLPTSTPGAASATYGGSGNVKSKQVKKHKKRHRKHRHKKKGHKKQHKGKKHKNRRRASSNRRSGR